MSIVLIPHQGKFSLQQTNTTAETTTAYNVNF